MKKLALLLMSVVLFSSCQLDDDGPTIMTVLTQVQTADFPEYLELGETERIEVTYLLPDACHTARGIDVRRGQPSGEEKRDIYIYGVATYEANRTNCPEEGENIEKTASFSIEIDEDEPYTFFLWTGDVDVDNKPVFREVVIPVGAPVDEGDEDGEGDGEGEEGEGEGEA